MDRRWKNLGILLAIIVAVLAAFLFLQIPPTQQVTFDSGLSELNQTWSAENIEPYISEEELDTIPREKITELKAKTLAFKNKLASATEKEAKALFSLADVYIARLDLFLAVKESIEANKVYAFAGQKTKTESPGQVAGPSGGKAPVAAAFVGEEREAAVFAEDEGSEDVCSRIPFLENMHEKLKAVLQKLKLFESKLESFSSQYPEFIEKTEFVPNPARVSEIEETVSRNTQLIAELKVDCQ